MGQQIMGVVLLKLDHVAVKLIHALVKIKGNLADAGREAVGGGELCG